MPTNTNKLIPAPEIEAAPVSIELPISAKWPTRAGALEYTPAFRQHLADAMNQAKLAGEAAESGFWVGASGGFAPTETVHGREVNITPAPHAMLMAHTHPTLYGASARPSDNDINAAKKAGIPLITASDGGYYETMPDGHTETLADNADWENIHKILKSSQEPESHSSPAIPWEHKK